MKKSILFLFTILTIVACGGGDDAGGNNPSSGSEYLNVSHSDINFANTQSTEAFTINASSGCEWKITWDNTQTWIQSVNPVSGRGSQTVEITVIENKTVKENITALSISNTNGNISPRTVTLRQQAGASMLSLNVDKLPTFPGNGGDQKVMVSSNTSWQIEGIAEWITALPMIGNGNQEVMITASANLTKDVRTAILSFRPTGGTPVNLNISQAAVAPPTVQLPQVDNITRTEATVKFSFSSAIIVTSCGVTYSTEQDSNPDSHPYFSQEFEAAQGVVSIQLANLSPGTTYFIHAFAYNLAGRGYSKEVSFTTVSRWPGIDDNQRPNL